MVGQPRAIGSAPPATVLRPGQVLISGTVVSSSIDRDQIGGTWTGSTLSSATVTIGVEITMVGSITVPAGTTMNAGLTLPYATTCVSPADSVGIGGSWSGGGPYTLNADYTLVASRTLVNSLTAPAAKYTQVEYGASSASILAPTGAAAGNGVYALGAGTTMPDGRYRLWYRARDVAGNLEAWHYTDVNIDATVPPTPAIWTDRSEWYGSDVGESAFTEGLANTVYGAWVSDNNATSATCNYFFQKATDPGFTANLSDSGTFQSQYTYLGSPVWVNAFYYQFGSLADAQIYYYRVKSRDYAGNESAYSGGVSSTQDNLPPVINQNVAVATQTQVTLLTSATLLKAGTTATNAVDTVTIGGAWTGSGPYTLIG